VHVGFTAQSLPAEVQEKFPSPKRKNSTEDVLGVNLTDMTGLLLTGVKAIDNKQSQLEKTVAEQQQEIEALKKEIQQLKNK
jgi:cell division protein FtsB